ncbi:hypothetical protein LJC68_02040 [Bacteroidales bacterium OttesenSCG-928-B11]|nr:hypothetical protein [Bacteroidales bacterium OttesenSCG-928-C03]MDL2311642.1 hypothetical protein [Bacteroidales bacterium OttesenSCG-928-B11]MDL2326514.1 hypothetical protein [Bacteroidales bacterium OttesenSCG-928-A14]
MNKIIELEEINSNFWKAKYRGNYGIYTIKMESDGNYVRNFSCSCPSGAYPCKHINFVKNAINERISKSVASENGLFESAVKEASLKDLQGFITRFGLYNTSFRQAFLLEFAPQQQQTDQKYYSEIIGDALESISFDFEDTYDYHYECFEIDVLDQWLNKAKEYVGKANYSEAILIAKACIEEYAEWLQTTDPGVEDYISEEYLYAPFNIFDKAYQNGALTAQELLNYCKTEIEKQKYIGAFRRLFNDLIMKLTEVTDPEAFITMQDQLFNALSDKSSYEAEEILKRKIDFYKKQGDAQAVRQIIENNLQIESFRKDIVEELIEREKFKEAKQLINEYIQYKKEKSYYSDFADCWDGYLLEIAQKEKKTKEIRAISRKFIDYSFSSTYYQIYKSTFAEEEWPAELEKLVKHYQKMNHWFTSNVADIFVEERLTERLLAYLTKHPRIENLEKYHAHIATEFPKETLALYKQAIDKYMENTGRDIYENTVGYFKSMLKIKNGKETVKQLIDNYKIRYKNRKAMLEIFERFSRDL